MDGTQRYRCTACRRSFQLRYRHKVHESGVRNKITTLALNGSGIRDTARVLGISLQSVMRELKKREAINQAPPVHPTYTPDPGKDLRLWAAEMGSFVRCEKAQC